MSIEKLLKLQELLDRLNLKYGARQLANEKGITIEEARRKIQIEQTKHNLKMIRELKKR